MRVNRYLMRDLSELLERLERAVGAVERLEAHEAGEHEAAEAASRPGKRDFHVVCKKKAKSRKAKKAGAFARLDAAKDKAEELVGKKRGGFATCEVQLKRPRRKAETVAVSGRF